MYGRIWICMCVFVGGCWIRVPANGKCFSVNLRNQETRSLLVFPSHAILPPFSSPLPPESSDAGWEQCRPRLLADISLCCLKPVLVNMRHHFSNFFVLILSLSQKKKKKKVEMGGEDGEECVIHARFFCVCVMEREGQGQG